MAKFRSHFFSLSLSRSLVRVCTLSLFTSFQYKYAFAKSLWETFARIKVLFDEYNVSLVFIWFYFILYTLAFLFLEYIYLYSCLLLFVRLFHFNRVVKCREKGNGWQEGKERICFFFSWIIRCVSGRWTVRCVPASSNWNMNASHAPEMTTMTMTTTLDLLQCRESFPIFVREYTEIIWVS